ncbi:MAG: hypothetical protein K9J17_08305 [Flavobacteriales bacterium]|nr:hypothetical protein [Flavobacteriales bacterium]
MRITTGDLEIFESGTIISYGIDPITFHITEKIRIVFKFKIDSHQKAHQVRAEISQENEMTLEFTNFEEALGIGNTLPLELGTVKGRRLFLNYRIYSLADKSVGKTVHYTWYLGETVQNG